VRSSGAEGLLPWLESDLHVLALCLNGSEDSDEESDTRLYRLGCAFRRDVSFILESEGEYTRISTPEQLKPLLIPIGQPGEGTDICVMRTGLSATFSFEREPTCSTSRIPSKERGSRNRTVCTP